MFGIEEGYTTINEINFLNEENEMQSHSDYVKNNMIDKLIRELFNKPFTERIAP